MGTRIQWSKRLFALAGAFVVTSTALRAERPNLLVIVADDVGTDRVSAYGDHPTPAKTPAIDSLAERGVLFRNMLVDPRCSPTRAMLLTGRHGFRTGIGTVTRAPWQSGGGVGLDPLVPSLPQKLASAGYATGAFGKWHLADASQGRLHPLSFFQVHKGSGWNLRRNGGYDQWMKWDDGRQLRVSHYATEDTASDALAFVQSAPEPWFAWVAFNAGHGPYHLPPGTEDQNLDPADPADAPALQKLMIERMDAEIGRLLGGVDLGDTVVVVVGDNGTPAECAEGSVDGTRLKNTLYRGGINVPFVVAGGPVATGESSALLSGCDLFPTLAELAGAPTTTPDGVSFANVLADPTAPSPRTYAYAEMFAPNGPGPYAYHHRMVRDARWKLIAYSDGREELFDFENGGEAEPLPLEGEAYERLRQALPQDPIPNERAGATALH